MPSCLNLARGTSRALLIRDELRYVYDGVNIKQNLNRMLILNILAMVLQCIEFRIL